MTIDEKRQAIVESVPWWYHGWIHFGFVNTLGLAAMVYCVWRLENPSLLQVLSVPIIFLATHVFEWYIHGGPMHHRGKLAKLYDRHAKKHHILFTDERMAMESHKEMKYLLFPAWFLPAGIVATAPIAVVLGLLFGWNVTWFWFLTTIFYFHLYEWLHVSHHLSQVQLFRNKTLDFFRRHHTLHHNLKVMMKGNYNVSFPLWDWVMGTWLPDEEKAEQTSSTEPGQAIQK